MSTASQQKGQDRVLKRMVKALAACEQSAVAYVLCVEASLPNVRALDVECISIRSCTYTAGSQRQTV